MTRARSLGLLWPYVVAASLGYFLGSIALPAVAAVANDSSSTPLARVGYVLREEPQAPPAAWPALDADVQVVRSAFAVPERQVFDLLVAVRGLDNGGVSDWSRAEQRCRALGWPRCDGTTLAQLKELGRP
jgi:hypothetical protein